MGGSSEDDLTDVEGPEGWAAQRCDSTTDEDSSSSQYSPQGLPHAGNSADFAELDFLGSLDALPAAPDDAALAAPYAAAATQAAQRLEGGQAKRPTGGEDADGAGGPEPKRMRNVVMAGGGWALANTARAGATIPRHASTGLST